MENKQDVRKNEPTTPVNQFPKKTGAEDVEMDKKATATESVDKRKEDSGRTAERSSSDSVKEPDQYADTSKSHSPNIDGKSVAEKT